MVRDVVSADVLRRAVQSVAASTSAAQAGRAVAEAVTAELAEWCLIDLLEPPDLITRVVAHGRGGPLELPAELGPVGARRSSAEALGLMARLADAPGRLLRVSRQELAALASSTEPRLRRQGKLALRLGAEQVLLLGLGHGEVRLGVLVVGRGDRAFSDDEVELLARVADLAGTALDAVRLLDVQRDLSTALQRSLLPRLPVVAGLTLAARFLPARPGLGVGGDWYDAFALPGGDTALVVGDATGHDVRAATRMAELRNLLRAVAVDREGAPAATLERLDLVLAQLAPHLSGTCLYARLSPGAEGRLRWSSAGHLPPVLLRGGSAELLDSEPDLMLGVAAAPARHDWERELVPGDVVVLCTDGLVEDRRTALDVRLALLRAHVEDLGGDDLEPLLDGLVERLASGEDDIAVLAVRVDAPPQA